MVPQVGLEPTRLATTDFESAASTISPLGPATKARNLAAGGAGSMKRVAHVERAVARRCAYLSCGQTSALARLSLTYSRTHAEYSRSRSVSISTIVRRRKLLTAESCV